MIYRWDISGQQSCQWIFEVVLMVKNIEVNGTFVDCLGVRREVLMGNGGEMG